MTGSWRPRLQGCPTRHVHAAAGKALPAILVGLIGRVGSSGKQRLALPLAWVRADPADPRPSTHHRLLVRAAVAQGAADDALVLEAAFAMAVLQEEGATRYVVRCAKNSTFRRAQPPAYRGRGRIPTRGVLVRPLVRPVKGRTLAATPPDHAETWQDDGVALHAEVWDDLAVSNAAPGAPAFTVVAVHDPRYRQPLLHALYQDRWPVAQLPLAAKQMLDAARAFVHAPETCQRLPALALLAGAILTYAAARSPAIPTGFWDRRPQPTPGRLRRALTRCPFPHDFPLPARLRAKAAVTAHLPTGFWGQRRYTDATTETTTAHLHPTPLQEAA